MKSLLLCLALLCLRATPVTAQDSDDVVARHDEPDHPRDAALDAVANMQGEPERERDGWAALPLASYSPETHLGLGAFGIYFFRFGDEATASRPSSLALVGLFTTREQAIVELIPELYLDDERWHLWNKLDFRSFPDSFWGIGADTPARAERRYQQESWRLRSWVRRRVAASLYVGLQVDAQLLDVEGITDGTVENVPGAEGGRTIGVGGTVGWDTRDNAVDAREGGYYRASLLTSQPWTGSEYAFTRFSLDLRQFFALAPEHTIGLQLYGELNAGDVPFHQMARLGGQNMMRGYFEGRFRDHDMLVAQVEYRFPIIWRLRGVAFAATGDVAEDAGSFDPGGFEVAAGAGLRFALNEQERLNLRADVGVGIDTWGVYVGIAEAF